MGENYQLQSILFFTIFELLLSSSNVGKSGEKMVDLQAKNFCTFLLVFYHLTSWDFFLVCFTSYFANEFPMSVLSNLLTVL